MANRPKLIALEGIDGSGKGTQAAALKDAFESAGKTVEVVSFPRYTETFHGQLIGRYLNGEFGTGTHPWPIALLFAGDRAESVDRLLQDCDIILIDRYVASNAAHQAARLPSYDEADARREFTQAIAQLEFDINKLYVPDVTVLLDCKVELARQNVLKKAKRAYTDKAVDVHEGDSQHLVRTRHVYTELFDAAEASHGGGRYGRWICVPVYRRNEGQGESCEMRPVEEITGDILTRLAAL